MLVTNVTTLNTLYGPVLIGETPNHGLKTYPKSQRSETLSTFEARALKVRNCPPCRPSDDTSHPQHVVLLSSDKVLRRTPDNTSLQVRTPAQARQNTVPRNLVDLSRFARPSALLPASKPGRDTPDKKTKMKNTK